MTKKSVIITVLCLILFIGSAVNGATISGTDLNLVSSGVSGTMDIMLDQAPSGIAGYQLEISINPGSNAEIISVNFPASFSMNSASKLPSSSVNIVAVDLVDQIKSGASNIILATLGIKGLTDGEADVQVQITELTDDSGNPISVTVDSPHIKVGSTSPTVSPTISPTVEPTKEPEAVPTTVIPTEIPTTQPTQTPTVEPTPEPKVTETLVAAFTAMPMTGTPPLTVNFTDHSTGSPKKWRWDFGDGTMSTIQNPSHVYGGIGRYTVTLEVISDNYSSVERKPEIIRIVGDYPTGPAGFAMVTSQPTGAEVYMGDVYLGTTPATLIVPAGSRSLTYQKEGYQKKTVTVTIRPNEMKLIPKVMLKATS